MVRHFDFVFSTLLIIGQIVLSFSKKSFVVHYVAENRESSKKKNYVY